jgi:hypothetical protein
VRKGRVTTGVLLWLAAAVAATAVGMMAVAAIGTDIFGGDDDPLSEAEVEAMLATRTRPPTEPTTEPTTAPATTTSSEPPAPTTIPTSGGTVLARCVPGGVEVVSAIPAQGYQADTEDGDEGDDGVDDGVDDHPSVTFSAGDLEIEVRLRCVNNLVTPEIRQDTD